MRNIILLLVVLLLVSGVVVSAVFTFFYFKNQDKELLSPFQNSPQKEVVKELPLNKYSIENLKNYHYLVSQIKIEEEIASFDEYTSYLFSYYSMDKKITGQLNVPEELSLDQDGQPKVIVLLRGYVPLEIYQTGMGTKSAAAVFAQNGYITFAPDFLSFGGSDDESEDSWESRFIKPINVIELIKSIDQSDLLSLEGLTVERAEQRTIVQDLTPDDDFSFDNLGIWAHSNGGQIALSVLEILSQPIPTTLWAPVTAPFPYSVLFFSDEMADEGKATRKWLSQFEEDYDVFDFSLTQHLDLLTGPVQLHHGSADEAALQAWSDEFVDKVELENERREEVESEKDLVRDESLQASEAGEREDLGEEELLPPIDLTYYKYSGADHNMKPVWNTVMGRDVEFFGEEI